MSQPRLILASGSPRRKELLEAAGYRPRVVAPREGAERPELFEGAGPAELVVRLARQKLDDVADQLSGSAGERLLLAADTVAECDGAILGKPADGEGARAMMRRLSGRPHRVYTGYALCLQGGANSKEPVEGHDATTLGMDTLSEEWIDRYVESGRWEGKAGGFGYQDGLGFVHIVEGSESNVVGLPIEAVRPILARFGCLPQPAEEP